MNNGPEIHLINPMRDAGGGSEWRTLELYEELKPHAAVTIWSEFEPAAEHLARVPIRRIRRDDFPKNGVLVFIGVYFQPREWIRQANPSRIIVNYNTASQSRLVHWHNTLKDYGKKKLEIVYASDMLRKRTGVPGTVQPSLINLSNFHPNPGGLPDNPFTVGRLSRDVPEKHEPKDREVYTALTAAGCRVAIMGGTCLSGSLAGMENVDLLPQNARAAPDFLGSLSCFYYRTGEAWLEVWGRIITEAMACGLPVVCHSRVGASEVIRHGENGFVFQSNDEAIGMILNLKNDVALRQRISVAARSSMAQLFSAESRRKIVDFYLRK